MKHLILSTVFLFSGLVLADQALTVKGDLQTAVEKALRFQLPNSSMTKIGAEHIRIETGNKNLLPDPSMEGVNFNGGWTGSNGFVNSSNSTLTDGKLSIGWTPAASGTFKPQSTLYAKYPERLKTAGVNMLASCYIRTGADTTYSFLVKNNSGVQVGNTVTLPATGSSFNIFSVSWVSGGETSVYPQISTSASAGTVYVDECYVGENINLSNGSVYIPWTAYTPTLNSNTNATITKAEWSREGEDLLYHIIVAYSGVGNNSAFSASLPTGNTAAQTSNIGYAFWNDSGTAVRTGSVAVAANLFNIYIDSATGAFNTSATANLDRLELTGRVKITEWIGSGQNVMSLNTLPNMTNWASYTPAVTNLGTGGLSELYGRWRKEGDSAHVRIFARKDGNNGTGAVGVLWTYPSECVGDTTKMPAGTSTLQPIGSAFDLSAGNNFNVNYYSTTQAYLYGQGGGGQWNGSVFAANKYVSLDFLVPCVGWSASVVDMPLVRNSVVSGDPGVTRVERLRVSATCSSSPCAIFSQSGAFTSVTRASTGNYSVNYPAATWATSPQCSVLAGANSSTNGTAVSYLGMPSTTTFAFITNNTTGGALVDQVFDVICTGPR